MHFWVVGLWRVMDQLMKMSVLYIVNQLIISSMKRLLWFFSIWLLLAGCMPTLETLNYIPKEEKFYGIDFRKYSDDGFYITPEKCQGRYEPVGLVEYVILPAATYAVTDYVLNPNYDRNDPASPKYLQDWSWLEEKMYIQEAVDSIYLKCKNMGADGIMNFDFSSSNKEYTGIKNPTMVSGYRLTGFAIKRLD